MTDILIQQNNEALVPPEFPTNVREQAPVLIQENILQDGGIAATVDVASTTTLDPDTPAYVNNIGDEKHAILQFGIPKGETGAAGSDGVDGQAATITVGSTTTVDPDESAAVVNSGTSQNAVLDFSIPQGVQGEQGEQGVSPRAYVEQTATGAMIHIDDYMTETNVEVLNGQDGADGQAATVSVGSTTTGAAGTNASVVNSGSSSAAILDFTIPRGADGAAGSDGNDGFSPIATVSQTASGATISITDAQGTTTANITNGTDGTDGFTPVITATAAVNATSGTPYVNVYKTGTDEYPLFDFAFGNLKGETGSTPTPTSIAISSYVSMRSGFSNVYSYAYQFGKLMIVQLLVKSTSNFTSTQVKVGDIASAYYPANAINYSCSLGTDEWSTKGVGYLYMSSVNGEITIADYNNSGCKCAKINISYIIN